MSDLVQNVVTIDSNMKRSTGKLETVGRFVASGVSDTLDSDQNAFAELNHKVSKVLAVSSLVTGSFTQNQAASAYNKMDFANDSYLNEIGFGNKSSGAQAKLDSYLGGATFSATSNSVSGISNVGKDGSNSTFSMNTSSLNGYQMDQIRSAGVLNVGGVDYNAKIDGDNVKFTSFGATFDNTQNLKIDIDPLKGITKIDATVNSSSFTQAEKDSIRSSGGFTREGVNYNVRFGDDTSRAYIHAQASGSYANNMLSAVNKPMVDATVTMKGSALSENNLKAVAKNGEYNLGGMKFSATGGFNIDQYRAMSASAANANANVMRDTTAYTKNGKAQVVADIQRAGVSHIRNQSDYLSKNFNGSASSVKRCSNHIKNQLKSGSLSASEKANLTKQLDLLNQYSAHGGTVAKPNVNHRRTAGMMAVGNAVLGRDMMRGAMFSAAGVKMAKAAARGTGALTAKLSYMGSSAANRIVAKGIGKYAGKDNSAVKTLDRIQDKKKQLYQDRKDRARARKNGTLKDYKRNKRDQKWASKGSRYDDKLNRVKGKLSGTANPRTQKRLMRKESRIARRKGRYERVSRFRETVRSKLNVKARLANSRVGKTFGKIKNSKVAKVAKAPFKALGKLFSVGAWVKRIIYKIIAIIVGIWLGFFIIFCAPVILCMLLSKFISFDVATNFKNDFNNAFNYQQLIVDEVAEVASDYKIVCQIDATNHYLMNRQVPSENYPWFVAPKFGSIAHQWAWEESDNTSRYLTEGDEGNYDENGILIGSGDLMYEDTYKKQAERSEIDSITFNLYPIVAMSHMRYHDEFSFEQWETILGYTYYMFVVSHDISKYDTDQSEYNRVKMYGDTANEPGYDYVIDTCTNDSLYSTVSNSRDGGGIYWNPITKTLTRGEERCSNIYIHDFSPSGYTTSNLEIGKQEHKIHNTTDSSSYSAANDGKSIYGEAVETFRGLKKCLSSLIDKVTGKTTLDSGDIFDKGYTDVNSATTLGLRRKALKNIKVENDSVRVSKQQLEATIEDLTKDHKVMLDFDKNESGIFLYDGTEDSLPHAQEKAGLKIFDEGGEDALNGLGDVCDNYLEFCYGVPVDTYQNKKEDLWSTDEKNGTCGHFHTIECHKLICGKSESDTTYNADGTVDHEGHHHSDSCRDLTPSGLICGHHHKPWNSKDDPGCWKTVCICAGHCGSHLDPQVNIIQKVTYEGLAEDDNFKSPKWLTVEEIKAANGAFSGGIFNMLQNFFMSEENEVITVAKFRAYWYSKVTQWFSPVPRSPWGFYKKIGEHKLMAYLEACDTVTEWVQNVIDCIFKRDDGVPIGKNDPSREGWAYEDGKNAVDDPDNQDKWRWDGWWQSDHEFDKTLYDELSSMYGCWEEKRPDNPNGDWIDHYKTSEEWWDKDTTGEFYCNFPKMGIGGTMYTDEEIDEMVDTILSQYPGGLSDTQIAILKAALSRCGTFSYSMSGHQNAMKNDSGMGDCSGWVSGTLAKIFDEWKGKSYCAADFCNAGVYGGSLEPGCVIAKLKGQNEKGSHTGHVMIYAGQFEGPEGFGYYVMDCSSSVGGSSLRKISKNTLDKYKYVYKPY